MRPPRPWRLAIWGVQDAGYRIAERAEFNIDENQEQRFHMRQCDGCQSSRAHARSSHRPSGEGPEHQPGKRLLQTPPVPAGDLAIMRRIDEFHLDYPFAGNRIGIAAARFLW